MKKIVLRNLILTASIFAFLPTTFADTASDLEIRISELEAMINVLKVELNEHKLSTQENIQIKPSGTPKKSIEIDQRQPSIKWGGIIDLDTHVTHFSDGEVTGSSIARDFYIPSATPIGDIGEDPSTDFTAKSSRFYITANKLIDKHKIGGRIEMDFLGSAQGNEAVSNSYSPRLRRAFFTYDNWLMGQEWSTFQNTSAIPESASFLVLGDGMIFIRQPQIRYTKGNFQFAVENPNTNTNLAGLADDNIIPDLVARFNLNGSFGNLSISGLGRHLKTELGAANEKTIGYGFSIAGRLKVSEKNDIRFSLSGGEGIGRYMGLAVTKSADLTLDGSFEALPSFGGYLAYRHLLSDGNRLNIGGGGIIIDNLDSASDKMTKQVQSGYIAYMWDIAPKVTLGVEFMHAVRENESGENGDMNRFTFSTKYAF